MGPPTPRSRRCEATRTAVQQLFDLAIARLDLNNGLLLVNDRALPLDFAADDVTAVMTYDRSDRRYDGTVQAGKMDVKYQDFRDVAAQGEVAFSLWSNRLQIKSLKLTSEELVPGGDWKARPISTIPNWISSTAARWMLGSWDRSSACISFVAARWRSTGRVRIRMPRASPREGMPPRAASPIWTTESRCATPVVNADFSLAHG